MSSELPKKWTMETLETERLILRPVRQEDRAQIFLWASDPEVSRYTIWNVHQTELDTQIFLDYCFKEYAERGVGPWVIEQKETGQMVGNCGFASFHLPDRRGEIGYWISRPQWGKGYAAEAVLAIMGFGFEKLGLMRIEARCMLVNTASERVMQKTGMRFEGVLRKHLIAKGAFHDVRLYAKVKEDCL